MKKEVDAQIKQLEDNIKVKHQKELTEFDKTQANEEEQKEKVNLKKSIIFFSLIFLFVF